MFKVKDASACLDFGLPVFTTTFLFLQQLIPPQFIVRHSISSPTYYPCNCNNYHLGKNIFQLPRQSSTSHYSVNLATALKRTLPITIPRFYDEIWNTSTIFFYINGSYVVVVIYCQFRCSVYKSCMPHFIYFLVFPARLRRVCAAMEANSDRIHSFQCFSVSLY